WTNHPPAPLLKQEGGVTQAICFLKSRWVANYAATNSISQQYFPKVSAETKFCWWSCSPSFKRRGSGGGEKKIYWLISLTGAAKTDNFFINCPMVVLNCKG